MSIQSVDFIGLANAPSVNGYYDSRPETNTNSDQSISPTDFADISRIHRQNNDHPQHDYIHNPPQLSTTAISLPVQHSLYPINPLALGQDIKPQTDGWLFDNRPEGFAPNRALVYPSYSSSSAYPPNQHLHHQTTTHARVPHLPWTLAGSLDTTTGIFYRTPEHPRLRTAQACEKCRSRKAKCSGERPTCNRCLTRGLSCGYAKEGRMRGPNKPKVSDAAARGSPQGRASNVKNCMPDRPDMSQSAIDGVRACSENQTLSLMTGIQLEDSILSLESEEPRHRSTKPRPPPLHLDISPGSNHLDRPSTSQCSSEIGGDHFPPFLKHYPAMKSLFHLVSTESKSSDQVSMLQPNFTVAGSPSESADPCRLVPNRFVSQPFGIYGSDGSISNPHSSPASTAPSPHTPGSLASVYDDENVFSGLLYTDETPSSPCVSLTDRPWTIDLGRPLFGEGQVEFGRSLPIAGKVGWSNSIEG